jgi:hypothetical protein
MVACNVFILHALCQNSVRFLSIVAPAILGIPELLHIPPVFHHSSPLPRQSSDLYDVFFFFMNVPGKGPGDTHCSNH